MPDKTLLMAESLLGILSPKMLNKIHDKTLDRAGLGKLIHTWIFAYQGVCVPQTNINVEWEHC